MAIFFPMINFISWVHLN